jgi:hypothetical protein
MARPPIISMITKVTTAAIIACMFGSDSVAC